MAISGGSTEQLSGTVVSSYLVFNSPVVQSTQLREWLNKELIEPVCGPEFKPLKPCKRGEWPYLCDFFWVDKNGRLLTPDKKPVTDKSSTHVHLEKTRVYWGYIQECGHLEDIRLAGKPTAPWVTTHKG